MTLTKAQPLLTVFRDMYAPGVKEFDENCIPCDKLGRQIGVEKAGAKVEFDLALAEQWDTEACFVNYHIEGGSEEEPAWRLIKSHQTCLESLRRTGREVYCRFVTVDVDNPGHSEWDEPLLDDLFRLLDQNETIASLFSKAIAVYFTRHGLRLVFAAEEQDIKPEEYEPFANGLFWLLYENGLEGVDFACKDWTRNFKLPLNPKTKDLEVNLRVNLEARILFSGHGDLVLPDAFQGFLFVPDCHNSLCHCHIMAKIWR